MPNSIFEYKRVLVLCISLVSMAVVFSFSAYGYKQIKDANFTNVDSIKVLVVDGFAEEETTMDRAEIKFQVSGSGISAEAARKDLNATFGTWRESLDKKTKDSIVLLDQGVAADFGGGVFTRVN